METLDLTGVSTESLYMGSEITYTAARARLAALCDEVAESREPVIIHRRGSEDVAEHRVVYFVGDDRIDFLQARYHY